MFNKPLYNDDFPLQAVPEDALKSSSLRVSTTAMGSMTFLAQEAIGALITVNFGFNHLVMALIVCILLIVPLSIPIVKATLKEHIDIDLLSRSCGFGYLGASLSSLIYASYVCLFLVFETLIVTNMLKNFFYVPSPLAYIIVSLLSLPVALKGFDAILKFQNFTNYIYIFFEVILLVAVGKYLMTPDAILTNITDKQEFNPIFLGQSIGILIIFITQTAEQVDYLRFMPSGKSKIGTVCGLITGAFWIVPISINIICGGLLAIFMMRADAGISAVLDPSSMIYFAYSSLFGPGFTALSFMFIFVMICQIKINITNAYSGSLAWSNFGTRLTHSFPGRPFWLIFNIIIVLILLEGNLYSTSIDVFNLISILSAPWFTILAVDLSVNRLLKLRPEKIEFKRGNLYDLNPVGVIALICAIITGALAQSGVFGTVLSSYATLLSMSMAAVLTPIIAFISKGRFYTHADTDTLLQIDNALTVCSVCHKPFDKRNILYCPSSKQFICSHCCSLNALCDNSCNNKNPIYKWIHKSSQRRIFLFIYEYLVLIAISALAILAVTLGVESRFSPDFDDGNNPIVTLSLLLMLIVAIFALFFVLVMASCRRAQEELANKNQLLQHEIHEHQLTCKLLQDEKNKAEAANLAKNRYLSGISHELRTPLNVILGYGQLLTKNDSLNREARNFVDNMVSNGEYLSDLIEGLLDISRIEAGKLELRRDVVDLNLLIRQLGSYFMRLAAEKNIRFEIICEHSLPPRVMTDEKRLRQILTNLISNAIKYTNAGFVKLIISYKFDVFNFRVKDSGIGIKPEDLKRIFEPFQRIKDPAGKASGTGLGLTISSLLASIMGGDLEVASTYGKGSEFKFKIYLPVQFVENREHARFNLESFNSFFVRDIHVLEIDDNNLHSELIDKMLTPYGFIVDIASSCKQASVLINNNQYDIFLIDISMQDGDGWQLLRYIRRLSITEPAVMISAEATEDKAPSDLKHSYNGYLIKPVHLESLLNMLRTLVTQKQNKKDEKPEPLGNSIKQEFSTFLSIGYIQGILQTAGKLYNDKKIGFTEYEYIQNMVEKTDLNGLKDYLGI